MTDNELKEQMALLSKNITDEQEKLNTDLKNWIHTKGINLIMDYKTITEKLATLADKAIQTAQELNNQLNINMVQYMGERLLEENKLVDDTAKATLANLHQEAQATLDSGLNKIESDLDKKYFADMTNNQLAELEAIGKMELDSEEMKGYLRKFSGNEPALRRLEKIANDKGFSTRGFSYSKEMDFFKGFKNTAQGFVNAIQSGEQTTLNISANLLAGKVSDYNEISNIPLTVFGK